MNLKMFRIRIMFSKVVLLITFILLFITCREKTVETKTEEFNLNEKVKIIDMFNKTAINFTDGKKLKDITLISNDKKVFTIKEIVKNKPKLILKFSETNCSFCIDHSLKYIEDYQHIIGIGNIIIIAQFIEKNSLVTFKRLHPNIQSKIYFIKDNVFDLSMDKLEKPYLFIVDSLFIPRNVFIPAKEHPKRTDDYFKMIQNKL